MVPIWIGSYMNSSTPEPAVEREARMGDGQRSAQRFERDVAAQHAEPPHAQQ